MNLSPSTKEAFRELPQLLLDRSEHDDDISSNSPTTSKLIRPNSVREDAASSVSRWQWKFWKKSAPSPQKQYRHKHRKYPQPGEILTPLPAPPPPGRHSVAGLENLNNFIDGIAERHLSPSRPRSADIPASNGIGSPLPPLEAQILQRPRLFLDFDGRPTVVMEQLVRLQEYNEPNPPVNALQLAAIPKKCLGGDEIALMPCHSLQHRGYELLSAEHWREPVRDRNKNWLQDELPLLMMSDSHQLQWSMTRAPGTNNRGKWARYERHKLHSPSRSTPLESSANAGSPVKRPQRLLLRAQGVLISSSYCVVSVFGEGIFGRLYGAGLTGKDKKRCLHVEAYEPATSRTYFLVVTLKDIERVFRVGGNDPEREALLAPGRKQDLLRQLMALLYFEYPGDPNEGVITNDEAVKAPKTRTQVLKISPEIQLNESAIRRLEREEQLRQEEARRLEEMATLLSRPRRARHRVLCQMIKLRGRHFYVSVYHFPAQARNLVIIAYNPSASITYRLTIGLLEAASLIKLYPYPRSGFSFEQTLMVARGLLHRLQLLGCESNKSNAFMMIAINGGRKGPRMSALPQLSPIMTAENKREELLNKMLRDNQRSLQLELEMTQFRLSIDAEAERGDIRQKITKFEAKRAEINEKDQEHRIRIEEIDAAGGSGGAANADVKRLHEERRALKTARQALKVEMKAAAVQISELEKQLKTVSEKEKASGERAQRRADRARKRIREEVLQSLVWESTPLKGRLSVGQRTWLARIHIRPDRRLLASGGCQISGTRVRYSLFALESEANGASDVEEVDDHDQIFSLQLYDPATCSQCSNFVLSRLEWLALTKSCHEQQQLVPELALPTSDVVIRLTELGGCIKETRQALNPAVDEPPRTSSTKAKTSKAKTSSNKKKHEGLRRTVAEAIGEINRLNRAAPWSVLVKALCERCSITPATDSATFEITLNRCVFRAVSPVFRITVDENEDGEDGEVSPVYCRVHAEVLPLAESVMFQVWDPIDGNQWRIEYPESRELLHEFAIETLIEQQMHLEAIMTSLLLRPNAKTGCLELCFEE